MPRDRIVAVDAARGTAMVLVCLSHINRHFSTSAPDLFWWLTYTTRIATPTFLLLSGFIIGHLLRTDARQNMRVALLDRGLFLLIVAHVLLGLAELPELGVVNWLFGRAVITDAIGVALLVAVLLRGASTVTLAALGAAMCLASWWIATHMHPESDLAQILDAVLFDLPGTVLTQIDAPLIPYMGVFLIGMGLSQHLKPALLSNARLAAARRLAIFGTAAVIVGLAIWYFGRGLPESLYTLSKRPPGPAYLLLYGGTGLLMLAAFLQGQPRWLLDPIIRVSSTLGRASLMCYVLQDWLLFLVPSVFGFSDSQSPLFWFTYLVPCLIALYAASRWWDKVDGNRFLTVGLKRF